MTPQLLSWNPMAAEERLNLPCSGLLALLPLCTDCSEDLQAIRSDPFFFFGGFLNGSRYCFGMFWSGGLVRAQRLRFGWESEICIIWKKHEKTWDVCSPAKELEVCSRSKCQDAYRPLVRRDLWPLSHGRGGYRGSPWFDLVALKAWEQRIRLLRLCCFHPDDSLGVAKREHIRCLRPQEVVVKHDCMTKWCFLSQVQPVSHLRSFSIAAAWFREDTTLHRAFSPSYQLPFPWGWILPCQWD